MSESDMLLIKVPGSTANLGPGFDSIGMALNLYLTLEVEKSDQWEIIPMTEALAAFPSDDSNFIVVIAKKIAAQYGKELPPARIRVNSDIPLARGLGSSAAAIVAGIELADSLCSLKLTKQEKFRIASEIEGHPDNAGASVFGGIIVGCQTEQEIDSIVFHNIDFDIVAVVPREELLTKTARGVLPDTMTYSQSVTAGAVGNLLVAALVSGNETLIGKMMRSDLYHQPYRRELVPHMEIVEEKASQYGAFAVALSGAGPTVLCLVKCGKGLDVIKGLQKDLPSMDFLTLKIDQVGSCVYSQKGHELQEKATSH